LDKATRRLELAAVGGAVLWRRHDPAAGEVGPGPEADPRWMRILWARSTGHPAR
jgi:hypothetical protein